MTLPNGVTTHYAYDSLNRLTSLAHIDATGGVLAAYSYVLTADGRRTQAQEILKNPALESYSTNLVSYTYDNLNRLTSEILENPGSAASAYEATYAYDLAGNRVSRHVWVGGQLLKTQYVYDANDRLVREVNSVELAAVAVAPSGQLLAGLGGSDLLQSRISPQQVAARTGAMAYRSLPSVWSYWGFYAIPAFLLLAFALPIISGAWNAKRRRIRGEDRLLTAYRLPLFMRGTASLLAATTLLTSLPTHVLAEEWELYTQLDASNWGRAGTTTEYVYDDNGSLTSKIVSGGAESSVEEYTYDLQNRLVGHVWTNNDGAEETITTTVYRYNPEGIRSGKDTAVTINGVVQADFSESTQYLVDFQNPTGYAQVIEERDGSGVLQKSYTIGDDVLSQSSFTENGFSSTDYLLYDGHGSTRQLANAFGVVTAQYAYDAYGVMLGQTADAQQAQATSLLYSGERFDPTLQMYDLRARNYNQANGQFTSLDPYSGNPHDPQSLHKYAYCHTDPVNGVDPSGENYTLSGVTMAASIAGMFAGVAQYNYARCVQGQSAWSAVSSSLIAAAIAFVAVYYAPAIMAALTECVWEGGLLGGLFVGALLTGGVTSLTLEVSGLLGQATSGAYTPIQRVIIAAKILSIVLTGYLAGVTVRYGSDPSFGITVRSPQGALTVCAKAAPPDSAAQNLLTQGNRVTDPSRMLPNASGAADDIVVIGRQVDTAVAKNWLGHKVLDIDNWTLPQNDAFVASIINNRQTVYLGSPINYQTMWNPNYGSITIFGRELGQLFQAGYTQVDNYLLPPP